ncbi:MAG: hypothetical protein WA793_06235 [Sphingorhabdus sp.]|uniref:hypothetical protein n=1 Tax=Sphingorhabdus sp. TaxID=1902408 RepID=UPI003C9F2AA8
MFSFKHSACSLPILAAMLVSGCSLPDGEFPSLAKRPYETTEPVTEPAPVAEQVSSALPAELAAAVDALIVRHQKADSAFRNAAGAARASAQAAAGAAAGSESWAAAQVELSCLDVKRGDSVAALSDLDKLIAAEREKGADSGLLGLLALPQSQMAKDVAAQTAEIEALARLIS